MKKYKQKGQWLYQSSSVLIGLIKNPTSAVPEQFRRPFAVSALYVCNVYLLFVLCKLSLAETPDRAEL